MALTDQQYQKILQYSADEMSPDERKAFENSLLENKELYTELEFYIQLQSLSDSIEKKTGDAASLAFNAEKEIPKEYCKEIANARKNWEEKYENELKLKYGIGDTKTILNEEKKSIQINSSASRWLLAATLIGLISLAIFLLYSQDKKDSNVAINNKETDSAVTSDNLKTDSPKNMLPQENTSSKNIPEEKEMTQKANEKAKQDSKNNYPIDAAKYESLFASNFVKDTTPADADGRLRRAFALYNNSDFVNALLSFDKSETLVKRGIDEHKALTKFYTDYYRALSYLSIDSTTTAISYLKDSIASSPDIFWKSKVEWYLALAYLKAGNITEAKRLLQLISSNQAAREYKEKSSDLINELDKK
jgi:hypothetical protein